jgi:integrase
LRSLKWGQIQPDESGAWVRWRAAGEPCERQPLPGDVWQAIQAYLQASGRLQGMGEEMFVFAPAVNPINDRTCETAEDWVPGRCLSIWQLSENLKLYGRLAGIPEKKLSLHVLRCTAIRLRLDQGASLQDMQAFLDSRMEIKFIKYRLGKLP